MPPSRLEPSMPNPADRAPSVPAAFSTLRDATIADAAAICAIYNPYVARTTISFEEEPVSVETMEGRITEVTRNYPWLVAEIDGRVVGYAYAGPWRTRSAYRYSVESTVYVDSACVTRGLGTLLYQRLMERLRQAGIRQMFGGIALPNAASVALHERLGFRKVAHFEAIGWKFDQWIDVGYWQRGL